MERYAALLYRASSKHDIIETYFMTVQSKVVSSKKMTGPRL